MGPVVTVVVWQLGDGDNAGARMQKVGPRLSDAVAEWSYAAKTCNHDTLQTHGDDELS